MEPNEEIIARVEKEVYQGAMPARNKEVLRSQLKEWDRYVANEEREHSNSPVGDRNNMRIAN